MGFAAVALSRHEKEQTAPELGGEWCLTMTKMKEGRAPFFACKALGVDDQQSHEPRNSFMGIYTGKPGKTEQGQKQMEDVVLAKGLIKDIGGSGYVSTMIGTACDKLRELFPHVGKPKRQWTERRLWMWWNEETEVVRFWQMTELYQAAARVKEERALLAAARREHAEFISKTARIAALLEHQDEDFHSAQIEAMGQQSRGMGRAGDSRD